MSELIQFPPETSTVSTKGEPSQTIELLSGVSTLLKGGAASYVSIAAWKQANFSKASSYIGVVLEFELNNDLGVLGDGTAAQAIGLFGELTGVGKTLLGLVGVGIGGVVPQVPLVQNAAAENIGFSQITADISLYDALSVGGVFNDIAIAGDAPELIVRVRPIRDREYVG